MLGKFSSNFQSFHIHSNSRTGENAISFEEFKLSYFESTCGSFLGFPDRRPSELTILHFNTWNSNFGKFLISRTLELGFLNSNKFAFNLEFPNETVICKVPSKLRFYFPGKRNYELFFSF